MTEYVEFASDGHIGTITLNRPKKLNAITPGMYERIGQILDEVKNTEAIRVLIVQGKGRAFSSGFDIHAQVGDRDPYQRLRFIRDIANANRWKIWNMAKPVIAKVHGYCLGGAFELAVSADFIYAAKDAVMGEPEIQFGATPAFLVLPWLIGLFKTKELLLLGKRISGAEAEQIGLVTRAVPRDELGSTVDDVAQQLVKLPQPAIQLLKQGINRSYEVRGMKGAIEGWVDSTVLVGCVKTEESELFEELVGKEGIKAALKWRDERYQS